MKKKSTAELKLVPIGDLVPYANNARTHSQEQIAKLRSSLREFGFVNPVIVDRELNVLAGHGRIEAARAEGYTEVPCVFAEDLTEAQKKAYIIADNRMALDAGWDEELLSVEMETLKAEDFDLLLTGFDEKEIDALLNSGDEKDVEDDDFDLEKALEQASFVERGDVWTVGRHRLMCGDCTLVSDVDTLLGGAEPDMVFTDPPYNIAYLGIKDKKPIKNDKMQEEDFISFLEKSLLPCETMYVCCCWQTAHLFKKALENIGKEVKAMIIWDKVNPAQHLDLYFKQYEVILYCGKYGGQKTVRGDVWQIKREPNTIHPTMKPISLISTALKDQPQKKIVYDGFGGSGSTMMACEKMNRVCYMMELDEKYVSAILRRAVELGIQTEEIFVERNGEKIAYSEIAKDVEDTQLSAKIAQNPVKNA